MEKLKVQVSYKFEFSGGKKEVGSEDYEREVLELFELKNFPAFKDKKALNIPYFQTKRRGFSCKMKVEVPKVNM